MHGAPLRDPLCVASVGAPVFPIKLFPGQGFSLVSLVLTVQLQCVLSCAPQSGGGQGPGFQLCSTLGVVIWELTQPSSHQVRG